MAKESRGRDDGKGQRGTGQQTAPPVTFAPRSPFTRATEVDSLVGYGYVKGPGLPITSISNDLAALVIPINLNQPGAGGVTYGHAAWILGLLNGSGVWSGNPSFDPKVNAWGINLTNLVDVFPAQLQVEAYANRITLPNIGSAGIATGTMLDYLSRLGRSWAIYATLEGARRAQYYSPVTERIFRYLQRARFDISFYGKRLSKYPCPPGFRDAIVKWFTPVYASRSRQSPLIVPAVFRSNAGVVEANAVAHYDFADGDEGTAPNYTGVRAYLEADVAADTDNRVGGIKQQLDTIDADSNMRLLRDWLMILRPAWVLTSPPDVKPMEDDEAVLSWRQIGVKRGLAVGTEIRQWPAFKNAGASPATGFDFYGVPVFYEKKPSPLMMSLARPLYAWEDHQVNTSAAKYGWFDALTRDTTAATVSHMYFYDGDDSDPNTPPAEAAMSSVDLANFLSTGLAWAASAEMAALAPTRGGPTAIIDDAEYVFQPALAAVQNMYELWRMWLNSGASAPTSSPRQPGLEVAP